VGGAHEKSFPDYILDVTEEPRMAMKPPHYRHQRRVNEKFQESNLGEPLFQRWQTVKSRAVGPDDDGTRIDCMKQWHIGFRGKGHFLNLHYRHGRTAANRREPSYLTTDSRGKSKDRVLDWQGQ